MRQTKKIKILICILALPLFVLWYKVYSDFLREITNWKSVKLNINRFFQTKKVYRQKGLFSAVAHSGKKLPDIKYVLIWSNPDHKLFKDLGTGQKYFLKKHCPHINCYVTSDRHFLEDYTQFDAVLFTGLDLVAYQLNSNELPARRSEKQKYVFTSIDPSENHPVCSEKFNNYFNWTWTFRLDSDIKLGFITIRVTKNKSIIGPKKVIYWMKPDKMLPVSKRFKEGLTSKTKAAAWFASNCHTKSKREEFVSKLKQQLKEYGLSVDTFGHCGDLKCPKEKQRVCDAMIKKDYYFYLAFESSFEPDYVTEQLLHGLRNHAVPVVYGGADYSRFMPEGAYLDASKLGPNNLARKMNQLIRNPKKYADYFKWTNHFTYHMRNESVHSDDYCNMCKLLNNKEMVMTKSVYEHFTDWWNLPNTCGAKANYYDQFIFG